MTTSTDYLLGSEERELQRLEGQARMLSSATQTILRHAGIEPGMRVLDLGTGAGDVAFEAAELVGPTGSVVGIDQSTDALRWAARRIEARGAANIALIRGDLHTIELDSSFDAVVGRLVLLYTPDPAAVLRRYAGIVRPGGVIAAMEYEMSAAGFLPETPLSSRVTWWITEAFRRSGLDPILGARLPAVFAAAGLTADYLGTQGYCAADDPTGPRMATGVVRTLLPVLTKTGVAPASEIDIDTLEERMAADLRTSGGVFRQPTLVGAWARVAGER